MHWLRILLLAASLLPLRGNWAHSCETGHGRFGTTGHGKLSCDQANTEMNRKKLLALRSVVTGDSEVQTSDEEEGEEEEEEAMVVLPSHKDGTTLPLTKLCSYAKSEGFPTASQSDISSCRGCESKAGLIDYDICELSDGELRGPGYNYTIQGKTHAAFGCAIKKNCSWFRGMPLGLLEAEELENSEIASTSACRWRSTANCSMFGNREPWRDQPCNMYIPSCFGTAGFCDCNGDSQKNFNDTGFNCSDIINITDMSKPVDCGNSVLKCEDLC